jgi:hypothetical protein
MLRNARYHPRKGKAKQFVESILGRGSASTKLTTNIETFAKAAIRRGNNPGISPYTYGREMQLNRNKSLVWIRKPRSPVFRIMEMEGVLVHELAHSAVTRLYRKQQLTPSLLVHETISKIIELEYSKENNTSEYQREIKTRLENLGSLKNLGEHELGSTLGAIVQKGLNGTQIRELIQEIVQRKITKHKKLLILLANRLFLSEEPIVQTAVKEIKKIDKVKLDPLKKTKKNS